MIHASSTIKMTSTERDLLCGNDNVYPAFDLMQTDMHD